MFGSVYGIVSDSESGELLENATVTLSPGGKSKTTGSDGRYEFAELDPQQYTITVQKTGYQTNRKTVTAVVDVQTEANIPLTNN
jgi:carbon monoxide dehydrogenase subunit G